MQVRQMTFSIPEGGQATLAFPEPLTPDTVDILEQAAALMFSALRRGAVRPPQPDAGALEYASWATYP